VEEGVRKSPSEEPAKGLGSVTIGMDLGDKTSRYGVLDHHTGAQIKEGSVPTSQKGMRQTFGALPERAGSGTAFALGEPAVEPVRSRSEGGPRAASETDQCQQPEG